METTTSVLALMPATEDQIRAFCNDIITRVKEGDSDPIEMQTRIEYLNKVYKNITKGIKEEFHDAIPDSGIIECLGMDIDISQTNRKDYSNDSIWVDLNKKIKEREKFLSGITKEMADTETGEIVHPPIIKTSTRVSFKAK